MKRLIYADNAATTKLDNDAFEAMRPFLLEMYGNASQPYAFSIPAKQAIRQAREIIASCINAEPEEIFFTSGGTESDNWAIKGVIQPANNRHKILASQIEHHAVLNSCAAMERLGIPVSYIQVDQQGVVLPKELSSKIDNGTKLVSVMTANNEIGTIQPIKDLVEIAHGYGALFHTDAVQAVGHISIDVKELDVDLLSASAHKFNGPKGIGFLYVKKGTDVSAYMDGGAQESGNRAGTENVAGIVAMATALQKNCNCMIESETKLRQMEEQFIRKLDDAAIDYIRNGSQNRIPGNISISISGASGEMLLHRLDLKGICVSTGSACDSEKVRVSHVIEAIGLPSIYANGTIRISFGRDNERADAQDVATAIIEILKNR